MPSSLSDVNFTIRDGGLGAAIPSNSGAQLKIGVSSKGTPGVVATYGTIPALIAAQGTGPLVESAAQLLAVGNAGPVSVLPWYPSTFGTASAVTHTGPGAGSVAVSLAPDVPISAKVTAGALGTMTVQFSVNGGAYGAPITSVAGPWTIAVPGTLAKLTFAAATYVLNDVYTVSTKGVVTVAGTGPSSNVTCTSSPLDGYDVSIAITTSGALGTAQFTWLVDGIDGAPSPATLIPSAGVFVVPGTGIVLTFSGSFNLGDGYAFTTSAPSISSTDIANALDVAGVTNVVDWSIVHIVGRPSTAAGAATIAAVVDTKLAVAEAVHRYTMGIIECPWDADIGGTNDDAAAIAAFAAFSSKRVMVCVGDVEQMSQTPGGRSYRRSCAHAVSARLSSISPGVDAGKRRLGKMPYIIKLYRDEYALQSLNLNHFTTLQTYPGKPGTWIAGARMMAPVGSDYEFAGLRRVMDAACRITNVALFDYLNDDLKIDSTGKIDEGKAQEIETDCRSKLKVGLLNTNGGAGDASAADVTIDRASNILATGVLPVTIDITSKAYARQISVSIGFVNPAIAAAA